MSVYVIGEPFEGDDGQWYFHVTAKHGGEIVLQSEGYTRRASANKARHKLATARLVER